MINNLLGINNKTKSYKKLHDKDSNVSNTPSAFAGVFQISTLLDNMEDRRNLGHDQQLSGTNNMELSSVA